MTTRSAAPDTRVTTGYAPVNGVQLYWEERGSGGTPLVLVHGGFGVTGIFTDLMDGLAADRRVIAVELQGHGHTRDIDRPFSYEAFGDDLAAFVGHLGLDRADLLGYSLGGGACLRAAAQHQNRVRRLVLVSTPFRRDGWFPEVRAGMARVGRGLFEQFRQGPMFDAWAAVAPDQDSFPTLMDKTGALLSAPYDWTQDVRALRLPVLLVYGDADSIPPSHAAEFFALLGGGLRDADWDRSGLTANRLAILPSVTHYDVLATAGLTRLVTDFLD